MDGRGHRVPGNEVGPFDGLSVAPQKIQRLPDVLEHEVGVLGVHEGAREGHKLQGLVWHTGPCLLHKFFVYPPHHRSPLVPEAHRQRDVPLDGLDLIPLKHDRGLLVPHTDPDRSAQRRHRVYRHRRPGRPLLGAKDLALPVLLRAKQIGCGHFFFFKLGGKF